MSKDAIPFLMEIVSEGKALGLSESSICRMVLRGLENSLDKNDIRNVARRIRKNY